MLGARKTGPKHLSSPNLPTFGRFPTVYAWWDDQRSAKARADPYLRAQAPPGRSSPRSRKDVKGVSADGSD